MVHVPTIGELEHTSQETYERLKDVLEGPRPEVRDGVRKLLAEPGFAPVDGLPMEEHRERVMAQLQRVAEHGFACEGFPPSVGGSDDVEGFVTAFEMLSYGDVSLQVKVGVHFGLFGGAIQQLGSQRHHDAYLPGVIDVSIPGCFAMTETGHGSDVQSIQTTASYDPRTEEFVLVTPDRGAWKDYIGNAAVHATHAVVFAQLVTRGDGHGVHAFVVRIRDEDGAVRDGVTIEDDGHKMGLNGVDNGRIAFTDVRVGREALLDRFASVAPDGTYTSPIDDPNKRFFTMLGTLIQGRVSVAGAAVAASRLALAIAVNHAEHRTQFQPAEGEPEVTIMDYLAHQRRLLPLLARTYAYTFAQKQLVGELNEVLTGDVESPERRRRLETRAAGHKALATWHATRTIQEAREACGGFGYLSENRLAALKADLDVYTTFEGDNTVLLQLVAKALLTGFRDEFGEMNPLQTMRFVADNVGEAVAEFTNIRQLADRLLDALPGRDEETVLLDRGWQLKMFAEREEHLVKSAAMRLRSLMGDREPFEAFNWVQDHILTAAHAHVSLQTLEAFVAAIEEVDDEDVRELLEAVCDLYALSVIEEERAWFMEHGFLDANRSKAVVGTVNGLLRDLRPHAEGLVDAFAIPDDLLLAPIALRQPGESYAAARDRVRRDD